MTEISLHLQQLPGWLPAWLTAKSVSWLKLIDPPEQNPFPGVRIVVRTFVPDGESNELAAQGAAGGEAWFRRFAPFYAARPWVYAWEFVNEPQPMASADFRKHLAAAQARWNELMHQAGYRTVAYNLAVGWPEIGAAVDLKPGMIGADFLGLHEYSAPTMMDRASWLCLRYRRTCEELGFPPSRMLVTECGIDGGVAGKPQQGWRQFATSDQYAAQLAWYGAELASDGVPAAFVFTAGYYPPWQSFDVDEPMADRMQVQFASAAPPLPDVPPVVQPAKPLLWPFLRAWPISSTFAEHKQRKPPSTAPGIDIAAPHGRPIRAPLTGAIKDCRWRAAGGRSMWIVSGEWKVYLAHMSSVVMLSGESCRAGDVVGYVGSTGHSTGPHLHLSVQKEGKWVAPMPYMEMPL